MRWGGDSMTAQTATGSDQQAFWDSVVVVVDTQISSDLADEAIILELKAGMYYGLDPIGTRIWKLIQEPRSLSSLRDTLLAEYEVDRERCERDLMALLTELEANKLIRIQNEAAA
jgi:coenzyme PQQ synthesis protein D (PqqD)